MNITEIVIFHLINNQNKLKEEDEKYYQQKMITKYRNVYYCPKDKRKREFFNENSRG